MLISAHLRRDVDDDGDDDGDEDDGDGDDSDDDAVVVDQLDMALLIYARLRHDGGDHDDTRYQLRLLLGWQMAYFGIRIWLIFDGAEWKPAEQDQNYSRQWSFLSKICLPQSPVDQNKLYDGDKVR